MCPFLCLFLCPYVCQSVSQSVSLSVCLSVSPSLCLCIFVSVSVFVCLSLCSKTCGTGSQTITETRSCTNPTPSGRGARGCSGDSTRTSTASCNTQPCPSKYSLATVGVAAVQAHTPSVDYRLVHYAPLGEYQLRKCPGTNHNHV